VSLLRTTRLAALVLVLVPAAAHAAPASSRKPPQAASASKEPRHDAARKAEPKKAEAPKKADAKKADAKKAAPSGLKNASATSRSPHGSTANLGKASGPARKQPSRSIGSPTEGHLLGGAHLGDAPYLRIYPVYAGSDVRWGTDTLVGLVDRAAKSVRKQFPDAVLSVGHLSKAGGGELDHHASHESGRDADIGFYVKNVAGKPIYGDHMVSFVGDGTAPTWPGAHFDDARNWALVAAIVGDGHAKVTHLFVATPIRERLLAHAAKIGASPLIRSRASEVLAQPHGSLPHDDHFHIRIACPGRADKCIEHPVAKRHPAHGSASASTAHAAHPSHGPTASAHTAAPAPAHRSAPHGAPPAPTPPAKAAARPAEPPKEESAKSDSLIPSLSPSIPGLDSAVIPAPLTGVKSTWGMAKEAPAPAPAPAPKADAVSDPDGVLEHE
jgi:penicillin-insensitive murein DD-endopeptidase